MSTVITPESLRNFLALSYDELTMMNLEMKKLRLTPLSEEVCKKKVLRYLESEQRIKAVTVAFSNLEGRLHMLDYDKQFFLDAYENLTFDGSSIRGFSAQKESDLRLTIDWGSFRWLPADVFGSGKVLVFSFVKNQDGSQYPADFRGRLKELTNELFAKNKYQVMVSPEIEGFLLEGVDAEQNYNSVRGFEMVTRGGYFSAMPQDTLQRFIDTVAEVQRAMGFENEKDHPEVAPSQFEINFKYSEILDTCDQILLYKLIARQVAKLMGYTACFLPKPLMGVNGTGMHSNMSIMQNGKNLFYQKKSKGNLSEMAEKFATGIMYYANELCLTIVPSVNAYRRLDPHYEAPNEIKMSASDRGSMIRIPIGNEKSSRIEVRSVSPDAGPYLAYFTLLSAGMSGVNATGKTWTGMAKLVAKPRFLWSNMEDALAAFRVSKFMREHMGPENHQKYYELKEIVCRRSPRNLGTRVKTREVLDHHEVTNQMLWQTF